MKVVEALKQMAYATSPMKIAMLQKTIKKWRGNEGTEQDKFL